MNLDHLIFLNFKTILYALVYQTCLRVVETFVIDNYQPTIVLWPRPVLNSKWDMSRGEGFSVDLCCTGPLLTGSIVCHHDIHVYWLESKMAAGGHITHVVTNIFFSFW